MVQRHFKVLADYALSFPRLVEPNPSLRTVWNVRWLQQLQAIWFLVFNQVAQALDVGRARTIRDRRHQASDQEIYLSTHSSGGVHRKVDVGQPCSKRNIPFLNNIYNYI